ncbi:MAG: NAD(P)/FAD-dependent oxidoreductase, partial [Caulobacteraceae bacterium]
AEMLRRRGFEGSLCMVSDDADPPCDRPNLSKDYLAGTAPEEWIPLREPAFYEENGIALRLGLRATSLDVESRRLTLANGEIVPYDKLLLATGAEPIRLAVPGSDLRHVRTLRSLSDCRALIERARPGAKALVVGASFIGLEVAASLLKRGLEVHVAAPEEVPMERVLGPRLGRFIARLHEEHGVHFHLGRTVSEIEEGRARLDDRSFVEADLVVVGIGVRPRLELAQSAGLALDRGVLVDGALRTSAADVFAAGDIARWPDAGSKAAIRVEHWVVAERQGQTAAFNMLGEERRHSAPPFFWSQHYDLSINYVGHAEGWDGLEESGDPEAHDYGCRFRSGGRIAAYASLFRDEESLRVEIEMERSGRAKGGGPS